MPRVQGAEVFEHRKKTFLNMIFDCNRLNNFKPNNIEKLNVRTNIFLQFPIDAKKTKVKLEKKLGRMGVEREQRMGALKTD